jgi:hypothetical protein
MTQVWNRSLVMRCALITAAIAAGAYAAPLRAQDVMATTNDPRASLTPGAKNAAGVAAHHMRVVSWSDKSPAFDSARGLTYINSDLAFKGNIVYQGNFSGFMVWDVSNPAKPTLLSTVVCATDQGDPSIYGNLLFISAESRRSRKDCGTQNVTDGQDRAIGVRIFDVSDPRNPKLVHNIQTCRGSHTHTIVPHPTDRNTIFIYVGGSSGPRDSTEMAGCSSGSVAENPNTAQQRIDIIRVPLNNPTQAAVAGYARIFEGLVRGPGRQGGGGGGGNAGRGGRAGGADSAAAGRAGAAGAGADSAAGGRGGRGGRGGGGGVPSGPNGCHDLTSYPALNLVAGSCGSFGILLDSTDPMKPRRLDAAQDSNFSLWHTAVFNNAGTSVVFTDEWGGGTAPRCRATDPMRLGGNQVLSISNGKMERRSYFKMMAAQLDTENCVSHNGGLIPVPGRDIMVQGWYQGGVNVFDFTDPANPFEIAYFDRGPVDSTRLVVGGSWGAYYYNGYIYSSELSRGLDILELQPSEFLSQNEIDAAKLVKFEEYNPQSQPKIVWPAAFLVVRSYLDQLVRNKGLAQARTTAIATALTAAERATGTARRDQLNRLATALDADARNATDGTRVRAMAAAVRALAQAR